MQMIAKCMQFGHTH